MKIRHFGGADERVMKSFVCSGKGMLLAESGYWGLGGSSDVQSEHLFLLEGTGDFEGVSVVLHTVGDTPEFWPQLLQGANELTPEKIQSRNVYSRDIRAAYFFHQGLTPCVTLAKEPASEVKDNSCWSEVRVEVGLKGFPLAEMLRIPEIEKSVHACRAVVKAWQNAEWRQFNGSPLRVEKLLYQHHSGPSGREMILWEALQIDGGQGKEAEILSALLASLPLSEPSEVEGAIGKKMRFEHFERVLKPALLELEAGTVGELFDEFINRSSSLCAGRLLFFNATLNRRTREVVAWRGSVPYEVGNGYYEFPLADLVVVMQ